MIRRSLDTRLFDQRHRRVKRRSLHQGAHTGEGKRIALVRVPLRRGCLRQQQGKQQRMGYGQVKLWQTVKLMRDVFRGAARP